MIKTKTQAIIISITILFLSLQSHSEPDKLQLALDKAGNNRSELEKTLQYYQQERKDSLKYQAAVFLISNMPQHYTYEHPSIDSFYVAMAKIFNRPGSTSVTEKQYYSAKYDSVFYRWATQMTHARQVWDINTITADYLIQNIDEAYEMWKAPWGLRVSFDMFCKYILPYRVDEEPLSNWREIYKERKKDKLKALHARANATFLYGLCNALNWGYTDNLYVPFCFMPEYPLDCLIDIKSGTCRDYAYMAQAYCRAMGLPVAVDFCPQWGGRSMGHEWNVLLPREDIPLPFAVNGTFPVHLYDIFEEVVTKVYRKTYQEIDGGLYSLAEGTPIPPIFDTPFIMDVTGDYADTTTIKTQLFPSKQASPERFAYLSVFDNQGWRIVQWGKNDGDSVSFRAMGKECVYLPVYYRPDNNEDEPAGYPILCRKSGNFVLKPDFSHPRSIKVYRKYRYSRNLQDCADRLVGGYFQVANKKDFSDAITVDSIRHRPETRFNKVTLNLPGKFRYFRFVGAKGMNCNISEITLYEEKQKIQPDTIFAIDGGRYGTVPAMAFDGNTLTHFSSQQTDGGWVAVGFKEPHSLSTFYYLPRNDDNFIREDEEYELFYWDAKGWQSLGRKRGSMEGALSFDKVPENALLLLHNHTKGQEERIFTYEQDKQIWW